MATTVSSDPLGIASKVAAIQSGSNAQHNQVMGNMAKLLSIISTRTAADDNGSPVGSSGVMSQPVHVSGNVNQWVKTAERLLGLGSQYTPGIENMIQHESGGNPNSINRWDSNAQAGHPSQGLMQTIPGTFKEYALQGYDKNILDPVSNIIAGVRYALKNYGPGMIQSGGRKDSRGNYLGY